jgi:transcriptional regulator with XRE-family HTH domain
MNISENVRQLREANNLSRKEFAAAVGVHPETVGCWERGKTVPSALTLSFLRSQFGRAQKTPEITGESIRRLREIKGLTRNAFAASIGVFPKTLTRWESGECPPSVSKRLSLMPVFAQWPEAYGDGAREGLKIPEITGDWIRRLRETAGMKRKELAALTGVLPVTVAQWENGKTPSVASRALLRSLPAGCPAAAPSVRRDTPESVREGIKLLQEMNGMSRDEFAEAAGVHPMTVKNWECGKSFPSASMRVRLAGRFGVTVEWIRGRCKEEENSWINTPDTTGTRLKTLRESAGMSEEKFGSLCRASLSAVVRWENDRYPPKPEQLASIAEYFGVTPEWILYGTDAPERRTEVQPRYARKAKNRV